MIVQEISGGLGNQMFQYAYARALQLRQGIEVALWWSDEKSATRRELELPTAFPLRARLLSDPELKEFLGWQQSRFLRKTLRKLRCQGLLPRLVEEPHFHFAPEFRTVPDRVLVRGYWQSEKYFADYGDEIRSEFRFYRPLSDESRLLAERIAAEDETPVSIHVRRGDYVSVPSIRRKHGSCSAEYYREAVEFLAARLSRPRFYLFSDDIGWVKENFEIRHPHLFSEHHAGRASEDDLRLMALCKHHVIANSTFSWWGAWLNPDPEKIVVAPKRWFSDGTSAADLIPAGWITL